MQLERDADAIAVIEGAGSCSSSAPARFNVSTRQNLNVIPPLMSHWFAYWASPTR